MNWVYLLLVSVAVIFSKTTTIDVSRQYSCILMLSFLPFDHRWISVSRGVTLSVTQLPLTNNKDGEDTSLWRLSASMSIRTNRYPICFVETGICRYVWTALKCLITMNSLLKIDERCRRSTSMRWKTSIEISFKSKQRSLSIEQCIAKTIKIGPSKAITRSRLRSHSTATQVYNCF